MAALTTVPRWTKNPVPGVGTHEVTIPAALAAALRRLANDSGVSFSSVLLAAHVKVLGALSGEVEVCTGYAVGGGPPLPLRVALGSGSWRAALLDTARAELELVAHRSVPVADPAREAGVTDPPFETVFEPAEGGEELAEHTVLRISVVKHEGLALRLRYRQDMLDADCAARIAGYHLNALSLLSADPDAVHGEASLLSADELQLQIHGFAGPHRELPDRRVHELFEEHVRAHPDTIAATHGGSRLTYRELNARANRLARALIARGVRPEGIVGVVTERTLGWMSAVLAIFKAGGTYLPIEPQFPADRIARMLSRAGCRLVLTEQGSTARLDQALASMSGVETQFIDAALGEGWPDGDPEIPVLPGQLAYLFFTSGSTGEPKGAMCEHVGMLNHLIAKIEVMHICEGDVVAQTAPQCFDISMWQLLSALLAGGQTLIIEQETILEAARFLDKIAERRVAVMQVVPSYLEVLVSHLERQPRELPHLRCVSVTGEVLKKELVRRWLAVQPRIKLVNAYGLTETSDDTNHEIVDALPRGEHVPVGYPINNVHIYVVDEHLSPVPLGAPGEIVFSGVCVGRGYINDPERTRRAFSDDPHRHGQRLYRSGDYGRWQADGKLEFLGRRDSQVKINGFRIEIGEIENRLLRLPTVREGVVVVCERADRSKLLVAFYSGDPVDPDVMRDRLGESLPASMIPSLIYWRQALPLTGNGKVDRQALTVLAGALNVAGHDREGPRTRAERWLASAWAEVLDIPEDRIGRQDHFFELGGTSLSVVRLAIVLDRAVTFRELTAYPILADQAELIHRRLHGDVPAVLPDIPVDRCMAASGEGGGAR